MYAHPDCSDSQLGIFLGEDGTYSAFNYMRISGTVNFLIWPVPQEYLDKVDANEKGDCLAVQLNGMISQSEPQPVYRSCTKMNSCPISTMKRLDGSLIVKVDTTELSKDRRLTASDITSAIQKELENVKEVSVGAAKELLDTAIESLNYELGGDDNETMTSLLDAVQTCISKQLSLILGLPPPGTTSGAFGITFKNLRLNLATGRLHVPCLGLIHDDTHQPQPEPKPTKVNNAPTNVYIHNNAVRNSYWVYILTGPAMSDNEIGNSVFIKHSTGKDYVNEFKHIFGVELENRREIDYKAGEAEIPLPYSHEYSTAYIDFLRDRDQQIDRKSNEKAIIKQCFKFPTLWPNDKVPDAPRVVCATNLALARLGDEPVAEIEIGLSSSNKSQRLENIQAVRMKLETLATEKFYNNEQPPQPPPVYRPLVPVDDDEAASSGSPVYRSCGLNGM